VSPSYHVLELQPEFHTSPPAPLVTSEEVEGTPESAVKSQDRLGDMSYGAVAHGLWQYEVSMTCNIDLVVAMFLICDLHLCISPTSRRVAFISCVADWGKPKPKQVLMTTIQDGQKAFTPVFDLLSIGWFLSSFPGDRHPSCCPSFSHPFCRRAPTDLVRNHK